MKYLKFIHLLKTIACNKFSVSSFGAYKFIFILLPTISCSQGVIKPKNFGKALITHYQPHQYQASESNWSMVLSDDGFMYSGNGRGVLEYDGNEWRLIKTPNDAVVISLSKSKQGIIYAGSNNSFGYLQKDQFGQMQYIDIVKNSTIPDKLFGEVKTVFAFDGSVYFAANKWLFRLNKDQSISYWKNQDEQVFSDVFELENKVYFTSQKYIYQLNQKDQVAKAPEFVDSNNKHIHVIETIKTDQHELIFTMNTVFIKDKTFKTWQTPAADAIHKSWTYDVVQFNEDYIAVATIAKGVFLIKNDGSDYIHISKQQGLAAESALSIAADRQNGLWVGVRDQGISRIQSPTMIQMLDNQTGLSKINKIIKYKNHIVGVSYTDIAILNNKSIASFEHYKLTNDQIETIIDSQVNGVLVGGGFGIDIVDINFDNPNNSHVVKIISGNIPVKEIIKSPWQDNEFYVRLKSSIGRLSLIDNQWHYEEIKDFQQDILSFAFDDNGLWLNFISEEIINIQNFTDKKKLKIDSFTIPNSSSSKIFSNSKGIIIFSNKQLYKFNQNIQQFEEFAKTDSKSGAEILHETQDNQIWLANKSEIIKYNDISLSKPNKVLTKQLKPTFISDILFDIEQGLNYIIGNTSIIILDKKNQIITESAPVLKSIKSDNQLISLNSQDSIKQHDLLFTVSYPDFSLNKFIQYSFCLNNKNCSNWSDNTTMQYSQLAGGDYQLKIKAKNKLGAISINSYQFSVELFWYQTLWFKLLAVISFALLIYIISKISTRQADKRNRKLEQLITKRTATIEKQADELHQLDKARIRFFANVSHEFRTPLTLAIAPLESLMHDYPQIEQHIAHPVNTSIANSKKMLSLVGQILDINRLESGRFPLRIAQYDVADLLNQLALRFGLWANKNQQTISTDNTQEPQLLYCDQEQLDKCLSNLISNAIKYSGNNTQIVLSIIKQQDQIGLQVSDNGQGISEQSQDKVFDRFYQDQQSETISDAGTGIGLSLVKELIELHHGEVELINTIGKGCDFILWMKTGNQHFDEAQLQEPINTKNSSPILPAKLPTPLLESKDDLNADITTVLVVDDNIELCDFIASRLSTYYRVIQKHDGQQGLETAIAELPDLIISDVMMPVMNGLEMSKQLKTHNSTKTIPIILLTAKSSKREVVEGLQTGADDYLSKPFDTSELIMRVTGLINNRKLIRETLKLSFSQELTQLDETDDFATQLNNFVTQQISNPNLSVDDIANELNISPASLFRKCNKEMGKPPAQIIRDIRMKHAMRLIKDNKLSISEIAYGTGFESLSYFSRTFKKHHGESPSSLRH